MNLRLKIQYATLEHKGGGLEQERAVVAAIVLPQSKEPVAGAVKKSV
jgi:hypothetical protein